MFIAIWLGPIERRVYTSHCRPSDYLIADKCMCIASKLEPIKQRVNTSHCRPSDYLIADKCMYITSWNPSSDVRAS